MTEVDPERGTSAAAVARSGDVEGRGVSKAYGTVQALVEADFDARFGEVHGLLGENGAGKSTFVKILTGSVRADAGQLRLSGEDLRLRSVADGIRRGIGTVFQELSLVPDLTVAENLFFCREPRLPAIRLVDRRTARRKAAELFELYGVRGIDPRTPVRHLPIAQQQILEIVKVVARRPGVLVLDEATSSLPRQDAMWLFDIVRRVRDEGTAVIFISHRLREAFEICDRVTVFRNGRTVSAGAIGDYTEEALVEAMLGRRLVESLLAAPPAPRPEIAVEVRDLSATGRFQDVSFAVRRGEILGLGGLQGQGQPDVLLALFGWFRPGGMIMLDGAAATIRSPKDALAKGIALVPEDRRNQGLMMAQSIRDNLTMQILDRVSRFGWISTRREQEAASSVAQRFSIRATSLEIDVQTLSGGNQQKVLIGKILSTGVKVLLLADITRGVDVGTKADIYALVRELAEHGVAVIFYSSDSTELVALCHRVAVMYDRSIAAVLEGTTLTEENLLRAAVGGALEATA